MKINLEKLLCSINIHTQALNGGPCDQCVFHSHKDCERALMRAIVNKLSEFAIKPISFYEAVFTKEEMHTFFFERKGDPYVEPAFVSVGTEKGASIVTPMGPTTIKKEDDGITYRLWNHMPTKEMQEKVPWK